jgi:hypothetical protein
MSDQVKKDEMGRECNTNREEKKNAYRIMVGKTRRKETTGKTKT